jgi:hypothetical protein
VGKHPGVEWSVVRVGRGKAESDPQKSPHALGGDATQDVQFKRRTAFLDSDAVEGAAEIGCGIGKRAIEVEENRVPGVGGTNQTRTARIRKLTSVLRPSE